MNTTLLESLTDMLVGMGLTEEDVMPLADLAECLVELDLDMNGELPAPAAPRSAAESARLPAPERR